GGPVMAQKFKFESYAGSSVSTVFNGQCSPFKLIGLTNSNQPAMLPPSDQISVSTAPGAANVSIYLDAYCSQLWSNFSAPMESDGSYQVYLRRTDAGTQNVTVDISSGGLTPL